MTGNLAETARHKLEHFGLDSYFDGVFGGEHDAHRNDLAHDERLSQFIPGTAISREET